MNNEMNNRVIMHIDANSAYLSWSAAYQLQQGLEVDLRTIPAVIGGDELSRHGIVLAKSLPAKPYKIQTGEPLRDAIQKCPQLKIVPPDYRLYMKSSAAMVAIISEYANVVQRFSIDECFIDYTNLEEQFGDPVTAANTIRERIKNELGFTVNIGISHNKILAKMASDFTKPDKVHTLYPEEVPEKLWPLPVGDLFMVGRQTEKKLYNLGINTIGQLANANTRTIYSHLKSYAYLIQNYARGIDNSLVRKENREIVKGIGNSTTVPFDVMDYGTACKVLLSLSEMVGTRLRENGLCAGLVSISIVTNLFNGGTHQRKLPVSMDSTNYIYRIASELLHEAWDGTPIRKLGVQVSELCCNDYIQMSLLENYPFEKHKAIDKSVDKIRQRFGNRAIFRACFIDSGLSPMVGGTVSDEKYPVMSSIL